MIHEKPVDARLGLRYNPPPKETLMTVKLILRDKEYEVKPGMALRDSLLKIGLLPEATLAIRYDGSEGQLITEDEILHDGDVIKLVAVISGGVR